MKVGIIDADLIGRSNHRFPNLAREKISGYWKEKGAEVHLLLSFDFVFQSEVQISIFDSTPPKKIITIKSIYQKFLQTHQFRSGLMILKRFRLMNRVAFR